MHRETFSVAFGGKSVLAAHADINAQTVIVAATRGDGFIVVRSFQLRGGLIDLQKIFTNMKLEVP